MKLTKLNSDKIINVNISKYLINWNRKISAPQLKVKQFLFPFWKNHIVVEEFLIPGSLYRIDLISFTSKVAIEVSPNHVHTQYNKYFHKSRAGFLKKLQSDTKKLNWAEKNGFIFIELYDEDLNNLSKEYFKKNFDIDL